MPPIGRMRHLTTVTGSFHGRLLAARLGAEDVLVQLKGLDEGPYPLQGAVEVYVESDQLELAREILLADAVEEAFASSGSAGDPAAEQRAPGLLNSPPWRGEPGEVESGALGSEVRRRSRIHGLAAVVAVVLTLVLVIVGIVAAGH